MPFSYVIKGHLLCLLTQITTMSNIRLVEKELKADKQLHLITALVALQDDGFWCDLEEYYPFFNKMIDKLFSLDEYKHGKHTLDCNGDTYICLRCCIEEYVDAAKEMISKYLES